ncbi:hypothetical protein [Sunxiuqinia elliptica]|uniref:Uncharacterized protein n=1 Tax=Sunxiuqinia elliptica TaxID=655355 RepID=A0A4R6GSU0_9BACT|nr:hypothetical protein [Sunxiuqinia elliptica]TDN98313.1 hypothetical protein DET52_108100 [Sunxiuqinia elliptica]TDO60419.1 hypothetical protein DET65_2223 [Sunxiuqinia elliptica]
MNQDQNKHMRMYLATQTVLDNYTMRWNTIPVMVTVKNELDELIQRIEQKNEETDAASLGTTAQKETTRQTLTEKAVTVSGILQAFAAFNDDLPLAEKVKLTKSDLLTCRETDVESLVRPVIELARKRLGNLADFMLTEDMLVETETSLDSFKALIGQPRTIRNQAFAAINMLEELMDQTDALLKQKLDKLMIRFEFSDSVFFEEYTRARVIVD